MEDDYQVEKIENKFFCCDKVFNTSIVFKMHNSVKHAVEEKFQDIFLIPRNYTDSNQVMATKKYETDYSKLHFPVEKVNDDISVLFRTENISGGLEKLDKKIKSIMGSKHIDGHLVYVCKICGKEAIPRNSTVLKNHIEAKHVNGISVPCNFCDKICRL